MSPAIKECQCANKSIQGTNNEFWGTVRFFFELAHFQRDLLPSRSMPFPSGKNRETAGKRKSAMHRRRICYCKHWLKRIPMRTQLEGRSMDFGHSFNLALFRPWFYHDYTRGPVCFIERRRQARRMGQNKHWRNHAFHFLLSASLGPSANRNPHYVEQAERSKKSILWASLFSTSFQHNNISTYPHLFHKFIHISNTLKWIN